MPFEISPKKVSVADQIAALIETGRAAHPEMKHIRKAWEEGNGGCAMSFAFIAAGINTALGSDGIPALAESMGADADEVEELARRVIHMNDWTAATLPEIVTALRENRLPAAQILKSSESLGHGMFISLKSYMWIQPTSEKFFTTEIFGDPAKWEMPKSVTKSAPATAKKLRVSAKTGKTWPAPKHAYA